MTDIPTEAALFEALSQAAKTHHEFEQVILHGVRHQQWSFFYAAFVLGRLGPFTTGSQLVRWLEDVSAPSEWSAAAAKDIRGKLTA